MFPDQTPKNGADPLPSTSMGRVSSLQGWRSRPSSCWPGIGSNLLTAAVSPRVRGLYNTYFYDFISVINGTVYHNTYCNKSLDRNDRMPGAISRMLHGNIGSRWSAPEFQRSEESRWTALRSQLKSGKYSRKWSVKSYKTGCICG